MPADSVWLGTPDGEGLGTAAECEGLGAPTGVGLGAPAGVGLGAPAEGESDGVGFAFVVGACVGAGVVDGVAGWAAGETGAWWLGPD